MLKVLLLTVALNAADTPYQELENYYWDCDTLFMKGELGGQDMWSCLAVTEAFQDYFTDRESFMRYWKDNKQKQWQQRGYIDQKNNG